MYFIKGTSAKPVFHEMVHPHRFGRHRKPLEDRGPKQSATEMHKQREQETGPNDRPETTTSKQHGGKVTPAEQQRWVKVTRWARSPSTQMSCHWCHHCWTNNY